MADESGESQNQQKKTLRQAKEEVSHQQRDRQQADREKDRVHSRDELKHIEVNSAY